VIRDEEKTVKCYVNVIEKHEQLFEHIELLNTEKGAFTAFFPGRH